MEFPELGKNCHKAECKQLDFLPMKCDGCSQIFCKDHFPYDTHSCPEAYRKNIQVPELRVVNAWMHQLGMNCTAPAICIPQFLLIFSYNRSQCVPSATSQSPSSVGSYQTFKSADT